MFLVIQKLLGNRINRSIIMDSKTKFTIPGNLTDDITAVIAYQNTQLIYFICKEKNWDPKELMKYFY